MQQEQPQDESKLIPQVQFSQMQIALPQLDFFTF